MENPSLSILSIQEPQSNMSNFTREIKIALQAKGRGVAEATDRIRLDPGASVARTLGGGVTSRRKEKVTPCRGIQLSKPKEWKKSR